MSIDIILLILIFGGYFIISTRHVDEQTKVKAFVIYSCTILALQSGLRNWAVGADTYQYYLHFIDVKNYSWERIFNNFYSAYFLGEGKDPGYWLLMKVFYTIWPDFQAFLMFAAIVFFSSYGFLLKRFAGEMWQVMIALLVYLSFYYSFFSITGIRQTLATAIIFFAVPYMIDKKLLRFTLCILAAAIIHKSALLFWPFYFISRNTHAKTFLLLSVLLFPLSYVARNTLFGFMTQFFITESYAGYTTGEASGAVWFTAYLIVLAIVFLMFSSRIPNNPRYRLCINALAISILLAPGTWIDGTLMRVVQYFSVFTMFFCSYVIKEISETKVERARYILITAAIFLFKIVMRNQEYAFFWQQMRLGANYVDRIIV